MEDSQFRFPWFDRRVWAVGGVLFLLLATAFVGLRAYKNFPEPSRQFDWESRGMSDFSSLYNYSKAFRDGANPYSSEIMDQPEYVLSRPAAPYSPVTFLPYVPLTCVPLEIAAATFFVFSWLMFGVLAWCCVRMSRIEFDWVLWVWVFAFLVFSRPGHITLFTGYFTVVSTLGTVVALHYAKSKPLLSGLGFLLATVKPTYAIPLTILMFARRDFKATISGVLLSAVFTIGCFAWLATHSDFGSVIDGIKSGQEAFYDDPTEEPVNTWTRIDVAGMVAKTMHRNPGTMEYLAVMMVLIVVPCLALWRYSKQEIENADLDSGAGGLTALIAVLAMLVTIYHHSYDCLIVAVAMVALLLQGPRLLKTVPRFVSICIGFLLAIPMLNYSSTRTIRDRFEFENVDAAWQVITMVNGICLTLALLVAIWFALKEKTASQSELDSA